MMFNRLLMEKVFLDIVIKAAIEDEKISKVPAEVTVGQAILESNWGKSKLAIMGNNLFGIKASPDWMGLTLTLPTSEVINGKWLHIVTCFRGYPDYEASVKDHSQFLKKKRYEKAFMYTNDWKLFLREIWRAGYATDPDYVKEVISVLSPAILESIAAARIPTNTETQLHPQSSTSTKSESLHDRFARYCRTYLGWS